MGSLPEARVTKGTVFERTGVDYAGPFEVKTDLPRSKVRLKKGVAVFVCMASMGVHLELVEKWRRRHSSVLSIGSMFLGVLVMNFGVIMGRTLLEQPGSDENESLVGMPVESKYIATRAPHQDGLWEGAVKSMKYQEDLGYLTAGRQIGGASMVHLFGDRQIGNAGVQDRYELVQSLGEQFWQRWTDEYLYDLQKRTKWREGRSNLKNGDMVIVMEDNVAPSS